MGVLAGEPLGLRVGVEGELVLESDEAKQADGIGDEDARRHGADRARREVRATIEGIDDVVAARPVGPWR